MICDAEINLLVLVYDSLRRIFRLKRDENRKWRKLHNEKLYSLYHAPNIVRVIESRRLRGPGHLARLEDGRNAFKILAGKPTGKRPSERPSRRWEDNIRMDLNRIGISTRNWDDSAQNKALNLRVA